MENFETKNISFDYESLRQEIADLKAAEMAKKEKGSKDYNPHFDNIEPAVLTGEDLNIYKEYKDGTLTLERFLEYQKKFHGVDNEKDPRINFMAWIGNATTAPEWIKKWYPEVYEKYFEKKNKKKGGVPPH